MYQRFQELPVLGRILVIMIALFVISAVLPIIVAFVKLLIKLAVAATIIVALLWLFDKVRGDNQDDDEQDDADS